MRIIYCRLFYIFNFASSLPGIMVNQNSVSTDSALIQVEASREIYEL